MSPNYRNRFCTNPIKLNWTKHVQLVILDCQHNQDNQGLCTLMESSENYLKRTSWEIGRIRLDEVFRNIERLTFLKLLGKLKHSTKCCLCDHIWSIFSQQTSNFKEIVQIYFIPTWWIILLHIFLYISIFTIYILTIWKLKV